MLRQAAAPVCQIVASMASTRGNEGVFTDAESRRSRKTTVGRDARARGRQDAAAVKGEPAEPERQRAEDLQYDGLLPHGHRVTPRRVLVVPRPDGPRRSERGDAARQVYHPSSGEIEETAAEREALVPIRGQPPTLVPGDVRHDRVDEGRQQARQQEVGDHVAPLGDRARDDRRRRRRETQPEEPLRLPPKARLPNRRGIDIAKAGRAKDAVGARISKAVVAVRDGVAHDPPARRRDGDVDVHDIFELGSGISLVWSFAQEPTSSMAKPCCMEKTPTCAKIDQ